MRIDDSVAREVLKYLSGNPDAADSLEGIAGWRRQSIADTGMVLDEMVRQGFVVSQQKSDGKILYHLNSQKREQIRQFLRKTG
jgi:DNA-binding MarR family transcriptional regulator